MIQLLVTNEQLTKMIDNYFEGGYCAWHKVYDDQRTGHSIYLGDIQAALDPTFILSQHIKTVVTAAIGMDHIVYQQAINHVIYPLADMKTQNISKFFNQFYELLNSQILRGNVLVHCAAGISRSATLVLSYLMKKHHWGFKEAIKFIRKSRPSVCPNLGFQRQLKEYQRYLFNREDHINLERRSAPHKSQERKTVRQSGLPQISSLGRGQLKSKILDPYAISNTFKFTHHNSQHSHRIDDKMSLLTSHKLDLDMFNKHTFKPKKSRSTSQHFKQLKQPSLCRKISHQPKSNGLKMQLPIPKVEEVLITKLKLNDKKILGERNRRIKPLHQPFFL